MKVSNEPSSICSRSISSWRISGVTETLSSVEVWKPSRVILQTCSSSSANAWVVCATIAEGSEATTYSPAPTPMMRGEPLRATTSVSGSSGADDADGVCAADFFERCADGLFEVALVELGDEHRHDFGVGVGGEGVPATFEVGLECGVVLDGAVVDDGDAVGVVLLGVGVCLVDFAVGCPAGVCDADGAVEPGDVCEFVFEDGDAADGADAFQPAVEDGDTGGVVAPVLHAFEPFDEEGLG